MQIRGLATEDRCQYPNLLAGHDEAVPSESKTCDFNPTLFKTSIVVGISAEVLACMLQITSKISDGVLGI